MTLPFISNTFYFSYTKMKDHSYMIQVVKIIVLIKVKYQF
jgi:hypothetical protein